MPNTHSTLTALFSDIADAIRSKTGGTASIAASAFPSAIAAIPTGPVTSGTSSISVTGIYDISSYSSVSVNVSAQDLFYARVQNGMYQDLFEDSAIVNLYSYTLASASFKAVSFKNLENVGYATFFNCTNMSSIYAPKLSSIGGYAFQTTGISKADFSLLSSIPTGAFLSCTKLDSVSMPSVTYIGADAFKGCTSLSYVEFSSCTSLGQSAFNACTKLESVSFPNLIAGSTSVFFGCTKLSYAYLPKLTYVSHGFFTSTIINNLSLPEVSYVYVYGFSSCRSLTEITLPKCTYIDNYAFNYCYNLSMVSLPEITKFSASYNFRSCYNLLSLYLLGSTVATLGNANAFYSTPISTRTTSTGGVYGSIFVPSSLYSSYITATNWVNYSSRFVSV
jgi:hypothetical protein